jgi:SAM-dependent methyltransferase
VPELRPCPCGTSRYGRVHVFDRAPQGEPAFRFAAGDAYPREIHRCAACGHFVSTHQADTAALYQGDYVQSNYGDAQGIRAAFERILALPPERSDNAGRVRRILDFCSAHFPADRFRERKPRVLDVGSGLCVFLHRMKSEGWDCTALDPDARSAGHAATHVGVRAVQGDFLSAPDLGRYDLVTMNKVLEHIPRPQALLAKATSALLHGGVAYVEVPDGEKAIEEGPAREEFFIDHFHVFSRASLEHLAAGAGMRPLAVERLREPSGKFTLRAILEPLQWNPA